MPEEIIHKTPNADQYTIVKADSTNIGDAARVHSVSWRESHKAFCTPEFVALHTPEKQKNYLQGKMDHGTDVFMLLDGRPVGIVSVTGNLIEDLYVDPACQSRGYGTALLKYAIRQCKGTPTLWILENNLRAARLYRRMGFRETGNRNHITNGLDEIEFSLRTEAEL